MGKESSRPNWANQTLVKSARGRPDLLQGSVVRRIRLDVFVAHAHFGRRSERAAALARAVTTSCACPSYICPFLCRGLSTAVRRGQRGLAFFIAAGRPASVFSLPWYHVVVSRRRTSCRRKIWSVLTDQLDLVWSALAGRPDVQHTRKNVWPITSRTNVWPNTKYISCT